MIDTSKAVRPCVEELAGWINDKYVGETPTQLLVWPDIRSYFTEGTIQSGNATVTNNDNGTFTISGSVTNNQTLTLGSNIPIKTTIIESPPTTHSLG